MVNSFAVNKIRMSSDDSTTMAALLSGKSPSDVALRTLKKEKKPLAWFEDSNQRRHIPGSARRRALKPQAARAPEPHLILKTPKPATKAPRSPKSKLRTAFCKNACRRLEENACAHANF